jgi:phosphoglycolate phosphatase
MLPRRAKRQYLQEWRSRKNLAFRKSRHSIARSDARADSQAGAGALLRHLHARGLTTAIFTNKHAPSSRLIANYLGFTPYLAGNFGAQDTPWLKPEPAFTAHVLTALNAAAATTLLVGDSPFDVQAALNAGFPCWAVSTGTHSAAELHAAGATRVFANLAEIQTALSD